MAYLRAISYEEARLAFFKVALTKAERSLDWAVKHIAELTLRSGTDCDVCEEKGDIVSYYKDVVAMLESGVDKGEFVSRKALLEAFENANADVVEEYEDGTRDWGFGMRNIREVIAGVPAADVEPVRYGHWEPLLESEITGWNPEFAGRDPIGAYVCSRCNYEAIYSCNDEYVLSDYCPNCGAKMD